MLAEGPTIELDDLPRAITGRQAPVREVRVPLGKTMKEVIARTLPQPGGDNTAAAALLGIGRRTIYRYLGH